MSPYTKINSKWIRVFPVKPEIPRLPEADTGSALQDGVQGGLSEQGTPCSGVMANS